MARIKGTLALKSEGRPKTETAPISASCTADYNPKDNEVPAQRVIVEKIGEHYRVSVEPPALAAALDMEFTEYKRARGFAGGLRLAYRWPIEDRTQEGGAK